MRAPPAGAVTAAPRGLWDGARLKSCGRPSAWGELGFVVSVKVVNVNVFCTSSIVIGVCDLFFSFSRMGIFSAEAGQVMSL